MKRLAYIALAVFVASVAVSAQEAKQETKQDVKYVDNSFGRLSHISGNVYIQRAADLGYEQGQVNMPVAEGDRIGTTDGRAEIFLGKKNYVRLDEKTKIDFVNLPKKDSDLTRIRIWAGNVYFDINGLDKEKAVEILTSDATFYVLENGTYRVNVQENKETEIQVFAGVIEASGEEGSVLVKNGQSVSLSEGRFLEKPKTFHAAADDAFDRFNDDRNATVFKQYARHYLPPELEDYESELAEYGNWVYQPEFGYVWAPRGMADDWRPYYYGRWTWLPMAGWSWIPYEPWGWGPFHYGRWQWGYGYGWYWIPMNAWGPAWVNWWWDDFYYGWAPMSYWGYPGIILDNYYYGRGWRGDYPINSRALTVVTKNQLQSPNIRHVALAGDSLKSIGRINLSQRTLDLKPAAGQKISVEQMNGGNKVIIRNNAEGSVLEKAGKPTAAVTPDRMIRDPKSETQKSGDSIKQISPRNLDPAASGRTNPPATKPPAGTSVPARRIRKDDSPDNSGATSYPSRVQNSGYPSRDGMKQGNLAGPSRDSSSGSILSRIFRSFSGSNTPPRISSSQGSVYRSPMSMPSPRMISPPSMSRGSGGAARSGGGVRKK